jgi:hypothetical protein
MVHACAHVTCTCWTCIRWFLGGAGWHPPQYWHHATKLLLADVGSRCACVCCMCDRGEQGRRDRGKSCRGAVPQLIRSSCWCHALRVQHVLVTLCVRGSRLTCSSNKGIAEAAACILDVALLPLLLALWDLGQTHSRCLLHTGLAYRAAQVPTSKS